MTTYKKQREDIHINCNLENFEQFLKKRYSDSFCENSQSINQSINLVAGSSQRSIESAVIC